jgi:hypothetical protein
MADFGERTSVAAEQHLRASPAVFRQNMASVNEVLFCVGCDEEIPEDGLRQCMGLLYVWCSARNKKKRRYWTTKTIIETILIGLLAVNSEVNKGNLSVFKPVGRVKSTSPRPNLRS